MYTCSVNVEKKFGENPPVLYVYKKSAKEKYIIIALDFATCRPIIYVTHSLFPHLIWLPYMRLTCVYSTFVLMDKRNFFFSEFEYLIPGKKVTEAWQEGHVILFNLLFCLVRGGSFGEQIVQYYCLEWQGEKTFALCGAENSRWQEGDRSNYLADRTIWNCLAQSCPGQACQTWPTNSNQNIGGGGGLSSRTELIKWIYFNLSEFSTSGSGLSVLFFVRTPSSNL